MNWNTPVRWGVICGLSSVIFSLLVYLFSPTSLVSMWFGLLVLGLVVFFMVWGGIEFRKDNNNSISYIQALGAVLIIAAISTLLDSLFSYILFTFIDTDLAALIKQKTIESTTEMLEKFNMPDDKIEEAIDKIKAQNFQFGWKEYTVRFLQGMGFYLILGAIVAAFVKRNPEAKTTVAE